MSEEPKPQTTFVSPEVAEKRRKAWERRASQCSQFIAEPLTWSKGKKMAAMKAWTRHALSAELTKADLKVAWTLQHFFNSEDGACFAKRSELASFAGVAEGTCRNALNHLEKSSLIVRRQIVRKSKQMTAIFPAIPEYFPLGSARQSCAPPHYSRSDKRMTVVSHGSEKDQR